MASFFVAYLVNFPTANATCPVADVASLEYLRVKNALVAITDTEDKVIGTGFRVNKWGDVVTARHVVVRGKTRPLATSFRIYDANRRRATVGEIHTYDLNPPRDVATLSLKTANLQKSSSSSLATRTEFITFVHDRDLRSVEEDELVVWHVREFTGTELNVDITKGKYQSLDKETGLFSVAGRVVGGNSGGPITNCEGQVVGIIKTVTLQPEKTTATHISHFQELAYEHLIDYDTTSSIFRHEVARRQQNKIAVLWRVLNAEMNKIDKQTTNLQWRVSVAEYNVSGLSPDNQQKLLVGTNLLRHALLIIQIEYEFTQNSKKNPLGFLQHGQYCLIWDDSEKELCDPSATPNLVLTFQQAPTPHQAETGKAGGSLRFLLLADFLKRKLEAVREKIKEAENWNFDNIKKIKSCSKQRLNQKMFLSFTIRRLEERLRTWVQRTHFKETTVHVSK